MPQPQEEPKPQPQEEPQPPPQEEPKPQPIEKKRPRSSKVENVLKETSKPQVENVVEEASEPPECKVENVLEETSQPMPGSSDYVRSVGEAYKNTTKRKFEAVDRQSLPEALQVDLSSLQMVSHYENLSVDFVVLPSEKPVCLVMGAPGSGTQVLCEHFEQQIDCHIMPCSRTKSGKYYSGHVFAAGMCTWKHTLPVGTPMNFPASIGSPLIGGPTFVFVCVRDVLTWLVSMHKTAYGIILPAEGGSRARPGKKDLSWLFRPVRYVHDPGFQEGEATQQMEFPNAVVIWLKYVFGAVFGNYQVAGSPTRVCIVMHHSLVFHPLLFLNRLGSRGFRCKREGGEFCPLSGPQHRGRPVEEIMLEYSTVAQLFTEGQLQTVADLITPYLPLLRYLNMPPP